MQSTENGGLLKIYKRRLAGPFAVTEVGSSFCRKTPASGSETFTFGTICVFYRREGNRDRERTRNKRVTEENTAETLSLFSMFC